MKTEQSKRVRFPLPADFPFDLNKAGGFIFRSAFYKLKMRHKVRYCLHFCMSYNSAKEQSWGDTRFLRVYERVLECLNGRFSSNWQDKVFERDGPQRYEMRFILTRHKLGAVPA